MPALPHSLKTATQLVSQQYFDMRWHILSLAADFDRIHRAPDGPATLAADPRIAELRACLHDLLTDAPDRAERVQLRLSDLTPPPSD